MNRRSLHIHDYPDSLPKKKVCKGFDEETFTLPLKFHDLQLSQ